MAPFEARRFLDAQDRDGTFDRALAELADGAKRTHWMWFVFPQLHGLGSSPRAEHFALPSKAAAAAYLAHPVLGERLRRATDTVLSGPVDDPEALLGAVDALKLRSSMTLFARAAPLEARFTDVLDRYYGGLPDPRTEELLRGG